MDEPDPTRKERKIVDALSKLGYITNRLGRLATLIGTFTLVNLLFCFTTVAWLGKSIHFIKTDDFFFLILMMEIFFLAIVVVSIHRFDRLRRNGDVIYQELSDEVEWAPSGSLRKSLRVDEEDAPSLERPNEIPGIEIRIAFRNFLVSSDLPLVEGPAGRMFYLLINFLGAILLASLTLFSKV